MKQGDAFKTNRITDRAQDFVWDVCPAGYRWVLTNSKTSPHQRQWFLVENQAASRASFLRSVVGCHYRGYQPLVKHSALFRKFAATSPDRDGILDFAGKYGLLGCPERDTVPNDDGNWEPPRLGEPLEVWTLEIETMRMAVGLWDAINAGKLPEYSDTLCRFEKESPLGAFRDLFKGFADDVQKAKKGLVIIINTRLDNFTSTKVILDEQGDNFAVSTALDNLLGAMWYQFALAVSATRERKVCAYCGTTFELQIKKGARSDKDYCSEVCKTRAYRARVAEAHKLYAEGAAIETISEKFKKPLWTAAKWALGKTSDEALVQFLRSLLQTSREHLPTERRAVVWFTYGEPVHLEDRRWEGLLNEWLQREQAGEDDGEKATGSNTEVAKETSKQNERKHLQEE